MNAILDITYVRKQSIINDNVDWELLRPIVIKIQFTKLRPLLGTNLFNEIVYQTTPTAPGVYANLTADNKILVDEYILPFLTWYLVAECLLTLKFRIDNVGIVEKTADNAQPSSISDVLVIEKRYSSDAQNYGEEMIRYIISNPTKYASYYTNNTIGQTRPNKSAFSIGWYIPDYRLRLRNDEGDFRYDNPNYDNYDPWRQ